jgi:hypothetical protein
MARRMFAVVDVVELLRRWQAGDNVSQMARALDQPGRLALRAGEEAVRVDTDFAEPEIRVLRDHATRVRSSHCRQCRHLPRIGIHGRKKLRGAEDRDHRTREIPGVARHDRRRPGAAGRFVQNSIFELWEAQIECGSQYFPVH